MLVNGGAEMKAIILKILFSLLALTATMFLSIVMPH